MAEKLAILDRDEMVRRYERDYQLRNPGALVGENTAPGIDARNLADQHGPLYVEISNIGGSPAIENVFGTDIEDLAQDRGLPRRLPAVGATGSVVVTTSVGGANIPLGLECKNQISGLRYQTLQTAILTSGLEITVGGLDTGVATDVDAGTILTWTSPVAGLASTCTVAVQPDGSGLTGGRDIETDAGVQQRVIAADSNPAVAGNAADYVEAALTTSTVGIQAAFAYPCALGPGSISLAFTVRSSVTGGSRIPNGAQIALVRSNIVGFMPEDDSLFMATVVADPVKLILSVRWVLGQGWTDGVTWPVYSAANHFIVQASPTPTPRAFAVATTLGSPPAPQPGQSIALFDKSALLFREKRIKSVAGTNPWTLTIDDSNGVSDLTYAPASGQLVGPWSDSLAALLPVVLPYFDTLGPGEQIANPYDTGGRRQKRFPNDLATYPSSLTGRVLSPLYALSQLQDVAVLEPALPRATTVGTPGTTSYLITLDELVVYPL